MLHPAAKFYFDEVTARALCRPPCRALFDHSSEDRFTAGESLAELHCHSLHVGDQWHTPVGVATRR